MAAFLGNKDHQSVRKDMPKINALAKQYLKIKHADLIESKPHSGYKINPIYKIKEIRT
jgi:hypothetical protein